VASSRERIFNVPGIILAIIAAIVLVQLVRTLILTPDQDNDFLILFSFIPMRYDFAVLAVESWARGWGAAVWTFVTYAFIHGNLTHLGINTIWLLAFGPPVARRFGVSRFAVFFAATAAAGAAVHLATHIGERSPVVGASAAISGAMAAAIRFVFQPDGPLATMGTSDEAAYRVQAAPLSVALRDPRVLAFVAVWFGINLLFGPGTIPLPGAEEGVAWQAHIGGFLAGLLGFALFDPVRPSDTSLDVERPEGEAATPPLTGREEATPPPTNGEEEAARHQEKR
jgi:membrane associated rhomboid family serine protease